MSETKNRQPKYVEYSEGAIEISPATLRENKEQEDKHNFQMAIYHELPNAIAEVVKNVREEYPDIQDEKEIQQMVIEAISGAMGRSSEIVMNSRPS